MRVMRLVNKQTEKTLVEFVDGRALIYNKFLEGEMRAIGISIPPGLRGVYNGKDCIRLGDDEFQKAFKEIYYITEMNSAMFRWEDF